MNPPIVPHNKSHYVDDVPLILTEAEAMLIRTALLMSNTMVEAGKLLGVTRHAIKRRCAKHGISIAFYLKRTLADYHVEVDEV